MKPINCILAAILIGMICLNTEVTAAPLPRSTPEEQGISSVAILEFVAAADQQINSLHSFMLVRHGQVVAEGWWSPYEADIPHMLFSLSKSFTSTAVGMAIAEGKLSLDDPVLPFFPEDAPAEPSDNSKKMRVRDLLAMSSGHHAEDLKEFSFQSDDTLTQLFLSLPVAHKPGTHFLYNTPGTYMCSAIVQAVTGETVLDYLQPRLFDPLDIKKPTWGMSPQGISLGGYGLNLMTEDIAKFGQLYLQKGKWNGQQLVPALWVEEATKRQTSNGSNPSSDWDQGYGYQFWRCKNDLYRGDGAFGQFCIVMPEQDAVVAITSGTGDMQGVMNLAWNILLPAMQDKHVMANSSNLKKLKSKLNALSLRSPSGNATSPVAATVSGKTYSFPENDQNVESVTVQFNAADAGVTFRIDDNDYPIVVGYEEWKTGRSSIVDSLGNRAANPGDQPTAASGAWTADDTFTAKLAFYETTLAVTFTLKFDGNTLLLDTQHTVSFGPTSRPQLTGTTK